MNRKYSLMATIALCFIFMSNVYAANTLYLSNKKQSYKLGKHLEYLIDSHNNISIKTLLTGTLDNQFTQSNQEIPFLGYSNHASWIKLHIINKAAIKDWILEYDYEYCNNIELYLVKNNKIITRKAIYLKEHIEKRDIRHTKYAFSIKIKKDESVMLYMRIYKRGKVILPLMLRQQKSFIIHVENEFLTLGIYYGMLCVIFLINLFVFISIKDRTYLYYVMYILFYALYQFTVNGLAKLYLWPGFLEFNQYMVYLLSPIILIFIILFIMQFLQIKQNNYRLYKIFNSLIISSAFVFLLFLILVIYNLTTSAFTQTLMLFKILVYVENAINSLVFILVYYSAIKSYIKGIKPALFIIAGWGIFTLGMIAYNLVSFQIIPYNAVTKNIVQAGSLIEIMLFSMALAYKLNIMKKQTEESQKKALKVQAGIIKDLETKVNQHTFDDLCNRYKITNMEQRVLRMVINGKSNNEISDTYDISYSTARKHINNLYRKTGTKNREELAYLFVEKSL